MDLAIPQVKAIPELVAERIIQGKDTGLGLKIHPGTHTYRPVRYVLVIAVIFVPGAFCKQEEIGIL